MVFQGYDLIHSGIYALAFVALALCVPLAVHVKGGLVT